MTGIARQSHEQQTHYIRAKVNFNDANVGTGNVIGTLPNGAIITSVVVQVTTAFNAGTTNALNIGTAAGGTQVGTDAATAGTRSPTLPNLNITADQDIFVQYAQTGTAATAGVANVIVSYVPNNDK
jgi:hypothetical protein